MTRDERRGGEGRCGGRDDSVTNKSGCGIHDLSMSIVETLVCSMCRSRRWADAEIHVGRQESLTWSIETQLYGQEWRQIVLMFIV